MDRFENARVFAAVIEAGGFTAAAERLGLHPLTVTSPWHGYHLGDWTETWETFARRATAGDWESTGRETLARQRTGVAPETSTKEGAAKTAE